MSAGADETQQLAGPVAKTTASRRRKGAAVLAALVAGWQLAGTLLIDPMWISKPSLVVERLGDIASSGRLVGDIVATVVELLVALALGTVAAVVLAVALSLSRWASDILAPFVLLAYSFPLLAVAPLFIIWFGIYSTSKIVFGAVVIFFVMFFNVFEGIRRVERDLIDTVRIMGAGQLQLLRMIVLPSTLLFVSAGLKSAVPFGLRAVVFAEMLISTKGLGNLVQSSTDSAGLFAALVLIILVGVVLNELVNLQERATSRWRIAAAT